jgi:hypothetical protein
MGYLGYWGHESTDSVSALDYMWKVIEHLNMLWDKAADHGERMAIVYVITEAPNVDITNHSGLKNKAATYLYNYAAMLKDRNNDGERQEEINYLNGLRSKLYLFDNTLLGNRKT